MWASVTIGGQVPIHTFGRTAKTYSLARRHIHSFALVTQEKDMTAISKDDQRLGQREKTSTDFMP
jgi:hypothetical protein